jgi:hypothetical protein
VRQTRIGIDKDRSTAMRLLPLDSDGDIAVIRYDGDPDVFTALAWAHCIREDIDYSIKPPNPRLYRCNPDNTGEYAWLLAEASTRGRGVWLGALAQGADYFEPAWMRTLTGEVA